MGNSGSNVKNVKLFEIGEVPQSHSIWISLMGILNGLHNVLSGDTNPHWHIHQGKWYIYSQIVGFRRIHSGVPASNLEIPERPENRQPTDRYFLYAFAIFILILIPLLGYTLFFSDIRRINFYDQCGNLCGYENTKVDQWSCTGKDLTSQPYLKFRNRNVNNKTYDELLLEPRDCVADCGYGYTAAFHRCIYTGKQKAVLDGDDLQVYFQELSRDLSIVWWRIVLALLATIVITALMLVVFRYAMAVFVWGVLIASVVVLVALTIGSWYLYSQAEEQQRQNYLIYAAIVSVITLTITLMFVFMIKKINLVIMLLKETTKAIFAMPMLTILPLLFFLIFAIIGVLFIYTTLLFTTSGKLTEIVSNYLGYKASFVMIMAEFINLVSTIWATQVILGIQYMIVAGAISKWFFAKNKNYLDSPISSSASIVFKFHLGTVAFGGLVITLVMLIRMLLKSLAKNKTAKAIIDCLMSSIEEFIKYLSKNAYIVTAMHGQGFWRSGKRATKLIFQNIVNIVAVNSVGDFVIGMAEFFVVLVSLFVSYLIFYNANVTHIYAAYIIVGIFALILASTIFSTFETAVDTIFICFCEDMLMNDGISRPYAMSKGLMEFLEHSKRVLGEKEVSSN